MLFRSSSGVSNHNDLAGLQGGTTSEYYHLTSDEYSSLGDKNIDGGAAASVYLVVQNIDGGSS